MTQPQVAVAVIVTLVTCASSFAADVGEDGTVQLFNGKNLDGWHVSVSAGWDKSQDQPEVFAVEDGAIRAYGNLAANADQPFASLVTDDSFSNYRLQLEYKWGEKKIASYEHRARDAGVMFHVFGSSRVWPNGVQYQIQEGDTGDIWAIGTRVSSKVHKVDRNYSPDGQWVTRGARDQHFARFHRSNCWEKPGWNDVEIDVNGNRALFKLNGYVVNEAINIMRWDDGSGVYLPLNEGKILLQAEGSEIFYRNIRITPRKSD